MMWPVIVGSAVFGALLFLLDSLFRRWRLHKACTQVWHGEQHIPKHTCGKLRWHLGRHQCRCGSTR